MMTHRIRAQLSSLYSSEDHLKLFFMAPSADEDLLSMCFQELTGTTPSSLAPLRPHASERRMYRIVGGNTSCIGVINRVPPENEAFVAFSRHFRQCGLPVPEILLYRPTLCAYLEEDLGNTTLLDYLSAERTTSGEDFPASADRVYRRVLEQLPLFQILAAQTLDFALCFPNSDFSSHALEADLRGFLVELVGRVLPSFNTVGVEKELAALIHFLADAETGFFMYRDFQARNIMLVGETPYFIDFQGGRKGPLQYDLVSLLYQASARLTADTRTHLADHYLAAAQQFTEIDPHRFNHFYAPFIVSRMLQVLGVYGKQGLGGGKEYFASSIPAALETLLSELRHNAFPLKLPRLVSCAENVLNAVTVSQGNGSSR